MGETQLTPRRLGLAFFLLFLVAAAPVLFVEIPPLFDYPNHLARMALLADAGASPVLREFYQVHWSALPNLAMDLIVPWLSLIMPLELAGRCFLLLSFFLTMAGAVLLNRALFRHWSLWPLAGFLLLYNRVLLWGFVNYLFGVGLLLIMAAFWLILEYRPIWLRLLVAVPLTLAVYFSHIASFGLLLIVMIGLEIQPGLAAFRGRNWSGLGRRLGLLAVPFLAPAGLFLLIWQPAAEGGVSYAQLWRKADLLFSVFDNYYRGFDVVCFVLFLAVLIGLALSRRLALHPRILPALVLVFLAYLALPSRLYTGAGADHRVPVILFLLLIAGSAPAWPRRRIGLALGLGFVLMFLGRMGVIGVVWHQADRQYRAELAAIDALPAGSRIALASPASAIRVVKIPEVHLPLLAIARRHAFVPTLFAFPAQQPVALTPDYQALALASPPDLFWQAFVGGDPNSLTAALAVLPRYDYVIFADQGVIPVQPGPYLTKQAQQSGFAIYAVSPTH